MEGYASAILGGSEDQKDTVMNPLEGTEYLRSELKSVKMGGDSTPSPFSPLPAAPLDDEAVQERRNQFNLQPTPPLDNNFKIDPKLSDEQFTVSTQDVVNQFVETNFYLQQLHKDQRAMMLQGVYLTEPQLTVVHELMERSIYKVATAVERSLHEMASLKGQIAELVGAVKELTQCQNSMGVNLNAVVSSTSHLAERLTQVEAGTLQQIAALGETVKGLPNTVHGLKEHREPNPLPNVLPSNNQNPVIQLATNQPPTKNNNVGWPQQAHSPVITQRHPNRSSQTAKSRQHHFLQPPRVLRNPWAVTAMTAAVNMPPQRPRSRSKGGKVNYYRGWSTRNQKAKSTSPPREQPGSPPNSEPPRRKLCFKCSICRLNTHFGWECDYRMGGPKHGHIPPSRTDILAEIASRNTPDSRMGDVNQ